MGSLLALPVPLVTRYLVDEVILSKQLELLVGAAALLALLKLGSMINGPLQQYVFTRFEQAVMLDVQGELWRRTLQFPMDFFDTREIGYLVSRLGSDINGIRWFVSGSLMSIATSILTFLGGAAMLFYLEWRLATGALILIPAMILTIRYFSRKTRVLSHAGMEQRAQVTERMQETLSTASLIKAFGTEQRESGRILDSLRKSFAVNLEQITLNTLSNLSLTGFSGLASFAVLIVGAVFVIQDKWTLGSLLAFQLYLGFVYGPTRALASANLQLQSALAALERLSAFFDKCPEQEAGEGRAVTRLSGAIEFRDVSFAYDTESPVLQDLSFKIEPGKRVALVGKSGIGKTTALKLLLGFYIPNSGEVLYDGVPIQEYSLASLRSRIGYVSQSTVLLSGTIAENLRYGQVDASDQELIAAAKTAKIHDFIQRQPDGYASHIGERGLNLSTGQQQRMALARALVRDPDILILDEPTAALDRETEQSIHDALPAASAGKTVIIVTHSMSIAGLADKIIHLD